MAQWNNGQHGGQWAQGAWGSGGANSWQQPRLHWSGLTNEELRAAGERKESQKMENAVSACLNQLVPSLLNKMGVAVPASTPGAGLGAAGPSVPTPGGLLQQVATPFSNAAAKTSEVADALARDPNLAAAVAERLTKRGAQAGPPEPAAKRARSAGVSIAVPAKHNAVVHLVILLAWQANLGCGKLPKNATTDYVANLLVNDVEVMRKAAGVIANNPEHPLVKQLTRRPQKQPKLRAALAILAEEAVEEYADEQEGPGAEH